MAYHIAVKLGIPIAQTKLAVYKGDIGVASYDIGEYIEPSDEVSYSIKDYLGIGLFIEMCLFDYLVMNEDRHCRNWGIQNGLIAPLYDHNICFSIQSDITDMDYTMVHLTSAFYVNTEYEQRYDTILKFLLENFKEKVYTYLDSLDDLSDFTVPVLERVYPAEYKQIMDILKYRIKYMRMKVRKWQTEF